MKIIIASDFHLSYRQYNLKEREEDFYKQYNKLIDEIIKEKPNLFIELGDIFDEPKPKPLAIKVFSDGIKKLKDNEIEILGVVGNHTTLQVKNFYPIDYLFSEDIKYLNGEFVTYNNIFIGGVGYHNKLQKDLIKNKINHLYESSKEYETKILLLHQGLKNDIEIGYEFDEDELKLNRFDYVFLGHLHKRTTRKNDTTIYHYPGGLNSCSVIEMIDETNEGKGYTIFDTETGELEFKKISSDREFLDIEVTENELNNNFIDETIKLLKGYSIKPMVRLKCITKSQQNIYDFVKKLEDNSLYVNKKILRNDEENESVEKFEFEKMSIEKTLKRKFDEKWKGDFSVELFKVLSKGDIESAEHLSEEIYKKHFIEKYI